MPDAVARHSSQRDEKNQNIKLEKIVTVENFSNKRWLFTCNSGQGLRFTTLLMSGKDLFREVRAKIAIKVLPSAIGDIRT